MAEIVDLHRIAQDMGIDLEVAFSGLRALYAEVDERSAQASAELDLPCRRGCDMCCKESVFLTPLEFFFAWDWAQKNLSDEVRADIVARFLALYAQFQGPIEALEGPLPAGAHDHLAAAAQIKFSCPFLAADGGCRIYPARELLARLFGCSFFDAQGAVYGCHLVSAHLAGKTVRLMPARATARRLRSLPLTDRRQVYPYYFKLFYG